MAKMSRVIENDDGKDDGDDVKMNLEPAFDIDVAHLVPAEEGVVFKNHLEKYL